MLEKVKAFFGNAGKKCKALMASAVAMVSAVSMAAIASAESAVSDTSSVDYSMATLLNDAGDQLIESFGQLVMTMIPVIMGILGGGLTIFGIFALIKLAKRIFGKVAG